MPAANKAYDKLVLCESPVLGEVDGLVVLIGVDGTLVALEVLLVVVVIVMGLVLTGVFAL